ncbi:MAG: PIN domain-containing protein [Candidatus Thiothrix moscowensis]|nr:PIN domain-containing protein [Candidatus Thiothrix moscowensis]
MKVYLDVCCLNRPFDDQSQDRIHLEAEAVLAIIRQVEQGHWQWVSSDVVAYEINNTPSDERKERLWSLEISSTERQELTDAAFLESQALQQLGFSTYDALHLALAGTAGVDAFLSTDDKLLKKARQYAGQLKVKAANPLAWLQEVI